MDLNVDLSNMERMGKEYPKAAASALNKMAKQVRTQAVKEIGQKYNLKAADIKGVIQDPTRATPTKLTARLKARVRGVGLIKFAARWKRPKGWGATWRGKPPATVSVIRGTRKPVKGAFIATMQSGHTGVFVRTGNTTSKGKAEIEEKFGPSPAQLFGSRAILAKMRAFVASKLPAILKHEIEWRLDRKGDSGE